MKEGLRDPPLQAPSDRRGGVFIPSLSLNLSYDPLPPPKKKELSTSQTGAKKRCLGKVTRGKDRRRRRRRILDLKKSVLTHVESRTRSRT